MRLVRQLNETRRQYGILVTGKLVMNELWRLLVHQLLFRSYSQAFEDRYLDKLVGGRTEGYYVDIGCHDPVRLSNTYRLYRSGWSGLAVDASPDHKERFERLRPRDAHVTVGVGPETVEPMPFYVHAASALSTFSQEQSDRYVAEGHPRLSVIQVPIMSLADILEKYVGEREIDFLSLDIEGLDFVALKSNDWSRFRPRLICFELEAGGHGYAGSGRRANPEIDEFLRAQGYQPAGVRGVNAFYRLAT